MLHRKPARHSGIVGLGRQVKVRGEAEVIGERAIRRAAAERATEEAAAEERAALAAALSGKSPDLEAAVQASSTGFLHRMWMPNIVGCSGLLC